MWEIEGFSIQPLRSYSIEAIADWLALLYKDPSCTVYHCLFYVNLHVGYFPCWMKIVCWINK